MAIGGLLLMMVPIILIIVTVIILIKVIERAKIPTNDLKQEISNLRKRVDELENRKNN